MIIAQLKNEPTIRRWETEMGDPKHGQPKNEKGVTMLLLIYRFVPSFSPTPLEVYTFGHTLNVLGQPGKIFAAIRRLTT